MCHCQRADRRVYSIQFFWTQKVHPFNQEEFTMRKLGQAALSWTAILALGAVVVTSSGCPRNNNGTAKITALFTADASVLKTLAAAWAASAKIYVSPNDVQSLTVTLTKIDLLTADQAEEEKGGPVVIFEGATDVDLIDLTGVSTVLSNAEIPAGDYTKIRLEIENPRLIMKDDPDTVITDVHLTANGRVFVNEDFSLVDGDNKLLLLDFGGIHLVENGNGNFVLTPQLDATLNLADADVVATGEIASVDTSADLLVLFLPDGESDVDYSTATIFSLTDTDTPTGTEVDLVPGSTVEVTGVIQVDGSIVASSIRVLAPPAP
jgi:hypothetical protein